MLNFYTIGAVILVSSTNKHALTFVCGQYVLSWFQEKENTVSLQIQNLDVVQSEREPAGLRQTQSQQSEKTINRLVIAMVSLMAEIGFVNMTTTSIAKRAGVSRGAMLHYFTNKVALVTCATGEMWLGVVASSDALREQSDPANPDPAGFVEAFWNGAMAQTHVSVPVDMMLAARGKS
jgi:hypothetical protein